MIRKFVLLAVMMGISVVCNSQDLERIPGKSYRPDNVYVEYIAGSLPLVISVPHGGYEKPADIPRREGRVATNQDIYTIEIAREMVRQIKSLTGEYPHVVINHLHRTRLDANRNLEEAAGGDPQAEAVWHAYHRQIDRVKDVILEGYGRGLFIDLHGHRHEIERIELGYLLSGEELRMEKEFLDEGWLNEFTGICHLLENNRMNLSFTELITGPYSLGSLLSMKGQNVVPSPGVPFPAVHEPFFPGGYNTWRHGSAKGGDIDGIQIEIDLHTRTDTVLRKEVAGDLARSLVEYLALHYFSREELPEVASYGDTVLMQFFGE